MRQRLGQHFLKNKMVLDAIVKEVARHGASCIVEIGPGHGELTHLMNAAYAGMQDKKIYAIEKDPALAQNLISALPRVIMRKGDARELLPSLVEELGGASYIIVGNLPYYLTGYLFRLLGDLNHKPVACVMMVQKEVAERIIASPPRMNKLAAFVQRWAAAHMLFEVPRGDFSPPPRVSSAVISLVTKRAAQSPSDSAAYEKVARALFQQPRKTVFNNIRGGFPEIPQVTVEHALANTGLAPSLRPQDLSVENIAALSRALSIPR